MDDEEFATLESRIGTTAQTVTGLAVTAGKVAEFSRAIADSNPVFLDEPYAIERGHDRMPAPPTFTKVGSFARYRPPDTPENGIELGFDPGRLLHGEQRYEYHRPVRVGDVLAGTTTLVDAYQREGTRGGTMTFAVLETTYTDQHETAVLTERSTAIETARPPAASSDDQGERETSPRTSHSTLEPRSVRPRTTRPPERLDAGESLETGDTGPTITVGNLSRQDFVRYAGASGDFNPIHYDEPYASAAGQPSVFGQGMLTAAITGRVLTDWVGIDAITEFGVRFRSRVFPGETVVATGEVTAIDARTTPTTATVELTATTDATTVLTGTATVCAESTTQDPYSE